MVELRRRAYLPFGVFGVLTVGDFSCWTVERPWKDNAPRESCIPCGQYQLHLGTYHRGGYPAYELLDVPGRSLIKIHVANWPTDVLGCIGLGDAPLVFDGQLGVPNSRETFKRFMEVMTTPASISIWNESGLGVVGRV